MWSGRSAEGVNITEGTEVKIMGNEGLSLLIKTK